MQIASLNRVVVMVVVTAVINKTFFKTIYWFLFSLSLSLSLSVVYQAFFICSLFFFLSLVTTSQRLPYAMPHLREPRLLHPSRIYTPECSTAVAVFKMKMTNRSIRRKHKNCRETYNQVILTELYGQHFHRQTSPKKGNVCDR